MQQLPPKTKTIHDEWGTTTREAYEQRPPVQPRIKKPQRQGSGFIKTIGALMIVGGIFWGTYLLTTGAQPTSLWQIQALFRSVDWGLWFPFWENIFGTEVILNWVIG